MGIDWKKTLGAGFGAMTLGPVGGFLGYKAGGGDNFTGDLENGLDVMSGKAGYDTAAAGAREAQAQAQALSQLQWQRQMQGLQEARGQTQPYLSLYDRIYGTQMAGKQTPVSGMNMTSAGMTPPGANGMPDQYAGRGLTPGGTRPIAPGHDASVDSKPVYAPIMRTGQAPPPQAPQGPPSQLQALLRPPTQQNGLEQLLARLRGGG